MRKKQLLYLSFALLLAVAGAGYLLHRLATHHNAGYVIVGYDRWVLESSLYVVAIALVIAFVLTYFLIRALAHAVRLPRILQRRGSELRDRRSREALTAGLIEAVEGNWEKAERDLIRHAADSGVPLINYLTAARAAHFRGAAEQRDEYLKLARESAPGAELAVGLTRAELQLSNQQFEEALNLLTELNRMAPSHAAVLRLMHQTYAQMEDWEALRRLIPALHQNKVLMEAEIRLLEKETYSALLKRKSETGDPAVLRELWSNLPQHVREATDIQTLYFAAMIEAGAGEEVEDALRQALGRDWSETLLVLYGCISMQDPGKQLQLAESWLAPHPGDGVLLRVLAKLAMRAGQGERVRDYLQRSLEAEPSVEAYQLMGDLLLAREESAAACEYYRKGLMLASNEVVARIERHPAADDYDESGMSAAGV